MKVKKLKDRVRVSLEGAMTVNQAAELKEALLKSLDQGDRVEVDCEHVTEVDLSFLQLLCAAHRTAMSSKKKLSIVDQDDSALSDAVVRAGFNFHKSDGDGSEGDCMWIGGKEQ